MRFRKEGKKRRKLDPVAISEEEAELKSIVNEHFVSKNKLTNVNIPAM